MKTTQEVEIGKELARDFLATCRGGSRELQEQELIGFAKSYLVDSALYTEYLNCIREEFSKWHPSPEYDRPFMDSFLEDKK